MHIKLDVSPNIAKIEFLKIKFLDDPQPVCKYR